MKRKKNKRLYWITGSAIVLVLFLILAKKAGWVGNGGLTKVATEKAGRHDITEMVSASGNIYPKVEVKISPDVSGEITELNVAEGDSVTEGEVLAMIKPDYYLAELDRSNAALNTANANLLSSKSQLTQMQAQFDQAQVNYDRNKKLHDNKVISDVDWEQIELQYKNAKAALESAQQSVQAAGFNVKSAEAIVKQDQDYVSKTTVRAPMSGIVSKLNVQKGERMVGTSQFSGTEMMSIADLYAVEARVDVSENDVLKISLGDTARVELDAYPDRKFSGVVTEVPVSSKSSSTTASLSSDQVTNFTVKILLNRKSYLDMMDVKHKKFPFLPGMTTSVKIMTRHADAVIAVPIQAVTTREDTAAMRLRKKAGLQVTQELVFLYSGGKVHSRLVTTGIQDNEFIEVKDGLKEGDEIVSAPFSAISKLLRDDMLVEKTDKEKLYKQDSK